MLLLLLSFCTIIFCKKIGNEGIPKSSLGFPRSFQSAQKALIGSTFIFAAAAITSNSILSNAKICNSFCKCKECEMRHLIIQPANAKEIVEEQWYNPNNERIFDTSRKSYMPPHPELYLPSKMGSRNVITIGEVHSNPCHHRVQFEIIKALSRMKNPQEIAIGLECFYRQHQRALDRFVFNHHNLAILKRETKWDETWGYNLNYYAKIFNFAAIYGIRLIGLNAPVQLATLVSQQGLSNLPSELKPYLPEMDLSVAEHKENFIRSLSKYGGHGDMDPAALQRLYETQTLWDEYMSESAANYLLKFPSSTLVLLAGKGHVSGRVSIPDRLQRRLGPDFLPPFVVVPEEVEWSPESGLPAVEHPLQTRDCDWAWYTQKEI